MTKSVNVYFCTGIYVKRVDKIGCLIPELLLPGDISLVVLDGVLIEGSRVMSVKKGAKKIKVSTIRLIPYDPLEPTDSDYIIVPLDGCVQYQGNQSWLDDALLIGNKGEHTSTRDYYTVTVKPIASGSPALGSYDGGINFC